MRRGGRRPRPPGGPVKERWASLYFFDRARAFGTFYETIRRYVRWLYWATSSLPLWRWP